MPEYPERTSVEDVLESSELAARLLRRLIVSPGVIDTQGVFKTYARLMELITHAHPLLQDLLNRYSIDDDSAVQNLTFVHDQPWMLNLNSYLMNNNSYSSSSTRTTNNSFFGVSNTNEFISPVTTSSSTHTELLDATSQSSPTELFRVSRSRSGRRQTAPVDAREVVLNRPAKLTETSISSVTHVRGDVKGEGPPRFADGETWKSDPARPASSSVPTTTNLTLVQPQIARTPIAQTPIAQVPLAPPVIQRELVETETRTSRLVLRDTETTKTERQSIKSDRIEAQQTVNSPQNPSAQIDTSAATTAPTLPLAQEHVPPSQFQTRPPQLVWRKNADILTLRDLVSDLSSSSPLAAVRQALDSLPAAAQLPPPNGQVFKPESSSRDDQPHPNEEITTEGMLRRISKMLLIERERRGY